MPFSLHDHGVDEQDQVLAAMSSAEEQILIATVDCCSRSLPATGSTPISRKPLVSSLTKQYQLEIHCVLPRVVLWHTGRPRGCSRAWGWPFASKPDRKPRPGLHQSTEPFTDMFEDVMAGLVADCASEESIPRSKP